jgi:hypothetical protein
MKTIMLLLVLFIPSVMFPQVSQVSITRNYIADEINKGSVVPAKYAAYLEYCSNYHNVDATLCGGFEMPTASQFTGYDEAVTLGQKMLDDRKAQRLRELGPTGAKAEELKEASRTVQTLAAVRATLKKVCPMKPDASVCKGAEKEISIQIVATHPDLQTYIETGVQPSTVRILGSVVYADLEPER